MKQDILNTVLDGYKLLAEHGSGSSGTVYQAENVISRQIVALKILSSQTDLAQRELAALRLFQTIEHPNLIRIHHIGQTGDQVFYTMDWCESSLAQRKVSSEELVDIAKKLAGALAELHKHGLIHRDIKPDNILFRNGEIVLGDIGLITRGEHATFAGSPGFMVPGQSTPNEYSDCYALAKSLYCALSGEKPDNFPFYPGTLSQSAAVIMRAALAVCSSTPKIRTASELLQFLNGRKTIVPRQGFKSLAWLSALLLFLFLAVMGSFFIYSRFCEQDVPAVPKTNQAVKTGKRPIDLTQTEANMTQGSQSSAMAQEVMYIMTERGKLAQWAEKCVDAEEKFKLEFQVCILDLLIPLQIRKYDMPPSKFHEGQKNLVEITNYAKRLLTAGLKEESKYILPEQKNKMKIADPKLNQRWKQANSEWESHKKGYVLSILKEIRKTGKKPEEILKKMAENDELLQIFGIDQLAFIEQYRNAWPETAKESVLADYLKRRNEFLRKYK